MWSSLAAPAPLLALSLIFESGRTLAALLHPTWILALSVAGLSYGGTVLGFGLWSRILGALPFGGRWRRSRCSFRWSAWSPAMLLFGEPLERDLN